MPYKDKEAARKYAREWNKKNRQEKAKRETPEEREARLVCSRVYNKKYYQENAERLKARSAEYRKENPEKAGAVVAVWYEANKEYAKQSVKEWVAANPERRLANIRRSHLKKKYNLSIASWENMFSEQQGRCGSCRDPLIRGKGTHVDHDHETGAVRELLCYSCNVALGLLKDEPDKVQRLLWYIERQSVAARRAVEFAETHAFDEGERYG